MSETPLTTKSKRKYNDISDPDDNTSIVYFLVVCHGIYVLKEDNQYNQDKQYEPEYVKIPENIKYVNKITYAPFGFKNILPDTKCIRENVTNICTDICPSNNLPGPDELIDLLQDDVQLLEQQRKVFNIRQKHKEYYGYESNENLKIRCFYKMLFNKEPQLYQNVVYSNPSNETKKNIPIIQKQFSIFPHEINTKYNIYVVFEKNGKLNKDDSILNSDRYKAYNKETYKGSYHHDMNRDITTQKLLEFAQYYGYENVVIFDYSCESCKDRSGNPIPRNQVMSIRELILSGQIGRGNKKTRNRSRNHMSSRNYKPISRRILRKYKKNQKTKRTQKTR